MTTTRSAHFREAASPESRNGTRPPLSHACAMIPALKLWSGVDPQGINTSTFPIIGFAGPPGTFPRLSMQRFLAQGRERSGYPALKDQIVIIAYGTAALQDSHPTRIP